MLLGIDNCYISSVLNKYKLFKLQFDQVSIKTSEQLFQKYFEFLK